MESTLSLRNVTQGYHVGQLFQQSLGGSNSSNDKVLNLNSNVSRVQGSIPASSIEINKSIAIDVSAVVIML